MNPSKLVHKSKNRIVFVLPKFGRGGAERVVYQLAKSLSNRNIDTMCICLEKLGSFGKSFSEINFRLVTMNSHRSYDLKSVFNLMKTLIIFNPSIVSVHAYSVLPYISLASLNGFLYPIIFTAHGLLYNVFKSNKLRYRVASYCLSGFTAVSNQVADRHRNYLNWSKHIEVIENGIEQMIPDKKKGQKLKDKVGIKTGEFTFINVGNIRPEKGIENLLQAGRILKTWNTGQKFCIVIVGAMQDLRYYDRVWDLCLQLDLINEVHFMGHIKSVNAVYAMGDAFILSSISEGLPLVVLEALSCGLPIIATKVGGVSRILRDGAGILIDPLSPKQMALAMKNIMNNGKLREDLMKKGHHRYIKKYTIESMAEKYISFFDKFI